MIVCLQGGAEFSPGCAEMDAALVRRALGPDQPLVAAGDGSGLGTVVVSALAGAPGRDYATATANGVRHFTSLGAPEVFGAPDAREDRDAALAVIERAQLLVLPGGSPSRLLAALRSTGVGEVVQSLVADGRAVLGSSAGAMVLCPWTVLPEGPAPTLAPGLGVVPGVVVVPHWTGARPDWLAAIAAHPQAGQLQVLGIPERSGVLFDQGAVTAVGESPARVVGRGGRPDLDLPRDLPRDGGPGLGPGQAWTPA